MRGKTKVTDRGIPDIFLGDGTWIAALTKAHSVRRGDWVVMSLHSLERALRLSPFRNIWIQPSYVGSGGQDGLELVLMFRDRFPQIQVDLFEDESYVPLERNELLRGSVS